MTNFFDEENLKKLETILNSWENTPYRHHCGVKGRGADCVHFVGRVLEELKIFRWRESLVPDYPRDWHLHNTREALLENLMREIPGRLIELSEIQDGDLVFSHYGKAASHAAIFYKGYLWQSLTDIGVVKINLNDQNMKKNLKYAYRVEKK